jgi:hypothetical protein
MVTFWQCCWCWICQRSAGVCRWCGAETLQAVTEEDEMENGYGRQPDFVSRMYA